jgi:RimJ/RimL family protein N-acetyltransferase
MLTPSPINQHQPTTKKLRMRPSAHQRLCFDVDAVFAFVKSQLAGLARSDDMQAVGIADVQGRMLAGVIYEGINAHNAWAHIGAIKGTVWARPFNLRAVFAYPFLVCKVDRLSVYVDASNLDSLQLCLGLGFTPEATLMGAAVDGGDVVILVMRKDACRYL